jgi:quercetin dioxygenase-like cupin family protein
MNSEQFLQLLRRDGFPEPVEVQQVPNGQLGVHEHPFAVKALVVEGDITIVIDGLSRNFKAGEIFHLELKQPHAESYGSEGVKYLASRKQ